jgi:hypothetical protein
MALSIAVLFKIIYGSVPQVRTIKKVLMEFGIELIKTSQKI